MIFNKISNFVEWEYFPNAIYRKVYITNKEDNIIRVHSNSIILLIFMNDIFLYTVEPQLSGPL